MQQSEDHRFQCEVRHVLMLRAISKERSQSYLARVEKARGHEAMWELRDEAAKQWQKGARGEWGEWK